MEESSTTQKEVERTTILLHLTLLTIKFSLEKLQFSEIHELNFIQSLKRRNGSTGGGRQTHTHKEEEEKAAPLPKRERKPPRGGEKAAEEGQRKNVYRNNRGTFTITF